MGEYTVALLNSQALSLLSQLISDEIAFWAFFFFKAKLLCFPTNLMVILP